MVFQDKFGLNWQKKIGKKLSFWGNTKLNSQGNYKKNLIFKAEIGAKMAKKYANIKKKNQNWGKNRQKLKNPNEKWTFWDKKSWISRQISEKLIFQDKFGLNWQKK